MSAPKYDMERLLDGIVNVYKDNLNAKIAEIQAEKADGMVLKTVDAAAYAVQELNGVTQNYNPYIFVGIEDIQSVGLGPHTADTLIMNVVLVLADEGEDVAIGRRLLRYSRAIRETLEKNWNDTRITKAQITSLVPVDFKLQNSSQLFRAVGIEIRAAIG